MSYIHETIRPNRYLPIKIFKFHSTSSDRIIVDHWHKSTELLYCVKGRLNLWYSGSFFSLEAGEIAFINANVIHSTQSPERNEVIVIQVPDTFIDAVSSGHYYHDVLIDLKKNKSKQLQTMIESIYEGSNPNSWIDAIEIQSQILELFHYLFANHTVSVNPETMRETQKYLERLSNITTFMKQHYHDDLSLEYVAQQFGFNMSYFSRFFKKYMGITFSEYLNNIRLDHAYRYLTETDMTIHEIADKSGFSNAKSFTTQFKRNYQQSPNNYRKSKIDRD